VLHDIGKIATPDAILFKPGPLTDDEWIEMQKHASFGADILSELPALAPFASIVRAHHERWDGKGYPYGLKGEQIPFEARVVAVADAFHAMISNRPYRPAIAQREAMEILREGRGTQWDAEVVDAMIAMLDAPRTVGRRDVARG
jgi:HD-GYP domain-containing protein (c-di-GMP phosphodiesterase class II)